MATNTSLRLETDKEKPWGQKGHNPVLTRVFCDVPHGIQSSEDPLNSFSVVSYNTLAQSLMTENKYHYVSEPHRLPESRCARLVEEMEHLDGDIICMQEVPASHYNDLQEPAMGKIGYASTYIPSPDISDVGLAVYFKQEKFHLLECECLNYVELAEHYLEALNCKENLKTCIKAQVMVGSMYPTTVLKFRVMATGVELYIVNCHIPISKRTQMLALWVSLLTKGISALCGDATPALIVCGDFNFEPSSPLYQIMRDGHANSASHAQFLKDIPAPPNLELFIQELCADGYVKMADYQPKSVTAHPSDGPVDFISSEEINRTLGENFGHKLDAMKSAYAEVLGEEPAITFLGEDNYGELEAQCLDYIWYSSGSLDVKGVLKTPPEDMLRLHYALPSVHFPSDHVSLKAVFSFKESPQM